MSDEETFPLLRPDDPDEQLLYLRRLQWRYPKETGVVEEARLRAIVRDALKLCPLLRIEDPKEVVRFLALSFLITPEQRKSVLLETVIKRIMLAADSWSARKRLNFIYKHVVGRPPPDPEPDFGPWFIADPRFLEVSLPDEKNGRDESSSDPT
jgi:hypothetical protein